MVTVHSTFQCDKCKSFFDVEADAIACEAAHLKKVNIQITNAKHGKMSAWPYYIKFTETINNTEAIYRLQKDSITT